jgi:hypothetical protein
MQKRWGKRLELHRETVCRLEGQALKQVAAASVGTNCAGSICATCTIGTDCINTTCFC